ncbi:MAG: hypothetical protein WD059_00460 [Balneolaceae bacterium]
MNSVKVYKTNVDDQKRAKEILNAIREIFPASLPTFDLDDCDKVLRIEDESGSIDESVIAKILDQFKYDIEVLP